MSAELIAAGRKEVPDFGVPNTFFPETEILHRVFCGPSLHADRSVGLRGYCFFQKKISHSAFLSKFIGFNQIGFGPMVPPPSILDQVDLWQRSWNDHSCSKHPIKSSHSFVLTMTAFEGI